MTWAAYRSQDGAIVVHLAGRRYRFDAIAARLFAWAILLVVAEREQETRRTAS